MYGYDSEYVVGMIVYMRRVQCCGVAIGHTKQNAPDSHPNSEVKLLQARVVLGWGTTREGRVLIAFLLSLPPSSSTTTPSLDHHHTATTITISTAITISSHFLDRPRRVKSVASARRQQPYTPNACCVCACGIHVSPLAGSAVSLAFCLSSPHVARRLH